MFKRTVRREKQIAILSSGTYASIAPVPRMYAAAISGAENQTIDEGNVTTATYTGTAGTLYFFYVTAYNAARIDSLPSNEVSGTAP